MELRSGKYYPPLKKNNTLPVFDVVKCWCEIYLIALSFMCSMFFGALFLMFLCEFLSDLVKISYTLEDL